MKRLFFLLAVVFYACGGNKETKPQTLNPEPSAEDSVQLIRNQILKDSLNPTLWEALYNAELIKGDTAAALRSLHMYTNLVP